MGYDSEFRVGLCMNKIFNKDKCFSDDSFGFALCSSGTIRGYGVSGEDSDDRPEFGMVNSDCYVYLRLNRYSGCLCAKVIDLDDPGCEKDSKYEWKQLFSTNRLKNGKIYLAASLKGKIMCQIVSVSTV